MAVANSPRLKLVRNIIYLGTLAKAKSINFYPQFFKIHKILYLNTN